MTRCICSFSKCDLYYTYLIKIKDQVRGDLWRQQMPSGVKLFNNNNNIRRLPLAVTTAHGRHSFIDLWIFSKEQVESSEVDSKVSVGIPSYHTTDPVMKTDYIYLILKLQLTCCLWPHVVWSWHQVQRLALLLLVLVLLVVVVELEESRKPGFCLCHLIRPAPGWSLA